MAIILFKAYKDNKEILGEVEASSNKEALLKIKQQGYENIEIFNDATQGEITSHLGYEKNGKSDNSNYRNGYSKKTLKSKYGEIEVDIPRDRNSTFEPKLVKKRQRLLDGMKDLILSLYSKGMSVKEIQYHLDDLYGYELSTKTISNITDRILEKANKWQNRPLEPIYPIIFMDATVLKIKIERAIKNIACYIMLGVTLEGKKDRVKTSLA